uniref:Uncharacterized protein n=1 Tax=Chromera velia CCMP2878 TaxID=1169474 RepID=A0A0G4GXL1_9ALVE|eukprot:Cvel_788.t1-p1 / transcript=Cvel_788.t1 / gene=Cvel_788 / organism=Chromera_velia_CCMP2878 / gene_product=hypothetical protein / transcript_product=hypothetical protein / location=Cvel_scaffold24:135900-137087(+) / protein_length=396 / sequence_SO=supercontig / SO=protein_coding / is_pseudo=false
MPKPLPLQSPCPRTTSSGHVLLILFVMCITTPRAQAKKSFVPVTLPDPGKIPESATDTERNPTFFYGRWAPPAPSANTPQSGEEVSSGRDVRVFADLPSEAEAQSVFVDQQGAPSPFTVPFHSVQREGMVEAPVQQQTDQIEQAPAAVTPSREVGAYQPGEEAPAFALPPSPFHQRDVPEARELYQSSPQSAFSPSAVSFVKQREGEEEGQSRRMARQGEAKKAVAIMGPFLSPQPHHSASPTGPFIVSADEPPPSTNNVIYVREPPRTHVVFIPRDPTPPSPSLKLHQFPMPMSVSVTTTPSPLPSVSVMTGPEGADLREYEVKRLDSPHQVPDGTMNHTTVITSTSRGSPWGGRPGITTVTHIRRAVPVRLVRRPVHPDFTVLVGSRRPPNYGQ